jgi:hypothetical protein
MKFHLANFLHETFWTAARFKQQADKNHCNFLKGAKFENKKHGMF